MKSGEGEGAHILCIYQSIILTNMCSRIPNNNTRSSYDAVALTQEVDLFEVAP